jgi:hypothetical protein
MGEGPPSGVRFKRRIPIFYGIINFVGKISLGKGRVLWYF